MDCWEELVDSIPVAAGPVWEKESLGETADHVTWKLLFKVMSTDCVLAEKPEFLTTGGSKSMNKRWWEKKDCTQNGDWIRWRLGHGGVVRGQLNDLEVEPSLRAAKGIVYHFPVLLSLSGKDWVFSRIAHGKSWSAWECGGGGMLFLTVLPWFLSLARMVAGAQDLLPIGVCGDLAGWWIWPQCWCGKACVRNWPCISPLIPSVASLCHEDTAQPRFHVLWSLSSLSRVPDASAVLNFFSLSWTCSQIFWVFA